MLPSVCDEQLVALFASVCQCVGYRVGLGLGVLLSNTVPLFRLVIWSENSVICTLFSIHAEGT